MDAAWWWQLLLVAAAVHVGLELVVHLVVYPALARSSTADLAPARAGHRDHMRRMRVAVTPVYGGLVVAVAGLLALDRSPLALVSVALVLATFIITAFLAVPAHEAIVTEDGAPERATLHRRLARVDLARLLLAVALLASAWRAA